jgi:hypothetical protein
LQSVVGVDVRCGQRAIRFDDEGVAKLGLK